MIKSTLHIVLIYFTVLLIMAARCSEQNKNLADKKTIDALKLKSSFESDSLAERTRNAFEERAIQKLYDFADYVNICSDKNLDKAFRDQAAGMITGLFIADSTKISGEIIQSDKGQSLSPGNFNNCLENIKYTLQIKISSIEAEKHLRRTPDNIYTGRLSFNLQTIGISSHDTLFINSYPMNVKIIAARSYKKFGIEERHIWNIFLGDMDNEKPGTKDIRQ